MKAPVLDPDFARAMGEVYGEDANGSEKRTGLDLLPLRWAVYPT